MPSFPVFTIGRAAFGLYNAQRKTGVIGALDWFEAALKVMPRMVVYVRRKHEDALSEMVSAAKAAVPQDTGQLLNGISGHIEDDVAVFEARALASDGQDYALYVEKGTRGSRQADDDFFDGDGGHAIDTNASHHGATPAEPFFYVSAEEPLEKRGASLQDAIGSAAQDVGF